ncbi:hypothetical protein [Legionella parisiensis]|uniref:Uncharacterized protein n=1 Tax=Legionella parisiensis TaxID=45071 RepID=A0A1E5JTQ7_9GAMM|nr:hypothetical protein [Legionella parisiensis]KTD40757.1 hypothetical protein Lpar_2074 [Legionella parisiensis]OEH47924.1 hypothetical protein lpari_01112 [Legionella parisiensis]STX76794.1 Uncharacterised protein [Legionella parisiensis]
MSHLLLKFGLLGSGTGSAVGLGLGAYYGGVLGAVGGAACGLVLGPPALLITSIAIGLACLTAAAAVAVPCFLGYLLMKAVLEACIITTKDTMACCL